MPPSAHAPLVVSIIASVLGALVMCLLVARYGLTPTAGETADSAARRLIVTRFGHAFAGVCFAATGILGLAALVAPARPLPPPPAPQVVVQPDPAVEARIQALAADIQAIVARVERAETRVGAVDGATRRLGDEIASVSARARQLERAVATPPPPRRITAPEPATKESPEAASPRDLVKEPARPPERTVAAPAPAAAAAPAPAPPAPAPARVTVDVPAPAPPPVQAATPPAPPRVIAPPVVRAPEPAAAPRMPPPVVRAPEPRSLPTASRAPDEGTAPRATSARAAEAPRNAEGGAAAARPEDGLGDKLREDWKKIRDGFETAGDDFKAAMRDLGRKLWR